MGSRRARRLAPGTVFPHQPTPQHDDVIVSRLLNAGEGFAISQVSGAVQISMSRRDAATELARRFAERHGLDLWHGDGGSYTLVESYRRRPGDAGARKEHS